MPNLRKLKKWVVPAITIYLISTAYALLLSTETLAAAVPKLMETHHYGPPTPATWAGFTRCYDATPGRRVQRWRRAAHAYFGITDPQAIVRRCAYLLSRAYGGDAALWVAVIGAESSYRVDAYNASGATGLGQVMPRTAGGFGLDAGEPIENVEASYRVLLGHQRTCYRAIPGADDARLRACALASYNWGPTVIRSTGYTLPEYPRETQIYIAKIERHYRRLQGARLAEQVIVEPTTAETGTSMIAASVVGLPKTRAFVAWASAATLKTTKELVDGIRTTKVPNVQLVSTSMD